MGKAKSIDQLEQNIQRITMREGTPEELARLAADSIILLFKQRMALTDLRLKSIYQCLETFLSSEGVENKAEDRFRAGQRTRSDYLYAVESLNENIMILQGRVELNEIDPEDHPLDLLSSYFLPVYQMICFCMSTIMAESESRPESITN